MATSGCQDVCIEGAVLFGMMHKTGSEELAAGVHRLGLLHCQLVLTQLFQISGKA